MSKRLTYVHRILRFLYHRRYLPLSLVQRVGLPAGLSDEFSCIATCALCRTPDLLFGFLFLPAAPAVTDTPAPPQSLPVQPSSGPSASRASISCSRGDRGNPWEARGCRLPLPCSSTPISVYNGLSVIQPPSLVCSARSRIRSDAVITRRSLASPLAPSGSACRCSLLTVAASGLAAPPGC